MDQLAGYNHLVKSKTHEIVKELDNKIEWLDARLYMPNPNHCLRYPCLVNVKGRGISIEYIQFIPASPYNQGYWNVDKEEDVVLWFTMIEFPHHLIHRK